jgi:cob(I)alamin adenosyltransferase
LKAQLIERADVYFFHYTRLAILQSASHRVVKLCLLSTFANRKFRRCQKLQSNKNKNDQKVQIAINFLCRISDILFLWVTVKMVP